MATQGRKPIPKTQREISVGLHTPTDATMGNPNYSYESPQNNRALQASFMLYAKKTGLKAKKPTVHFHSLRHGYATHCVRQGVKLAFLQVMLGHSDLATTSVYLRVAPLEAANEVRDKW
jgi:site-specific recombinase XerD